MDELFQLAQLALVVVFGVGLLVAGRFFHSPVRSAAAIGGSASRCHKTHNTAPDVYSTGAVLHLRHHTH